MIHIDDIEFEAIEFRNEYALLTELRLDKSSVPEGFYAYDLRHGDDWGIACTLEKQVTVNFYGTVVFNHPVDLPPEGFIRIDGYEDINHLGYNADLSDLWGKNDLCMGPTM